mgnify:CR=1 FL=1
MRKRRNATGSSNKNRSNRTQLSNRILRYVASRPNHSFSARQIIEKLKLDNNKDSIHAILENLEEKGFVIAKKGGKFKWNKLNNNTAKILTSSDRKLVIGKVDMTRSGDAYIIINAQSKDIFVPSRKLKTAMNGDTVRVEIIKQSNGGRIEGEVVEVISRALSHSVGTLKLFPKYGIVFPDPYSRLPEILVAHEDGLEAKDGDRVLVKIIEWDNSQRKSIWGTVVKILEDMNPNELAMQNILISSGFSPEFPEDVLIEAIEYTSKIDQEEIKKRRDFRPITTFTIDPRTAKDFDDALSIRRLENGHYEVGVHIADVTHYVRPNTAMDREAYRRSTSVYLVDRVSPMLPEKLSNDLCSLNPHEDKLCFSAVFEFDNQCKIVNTWIGKTIIHSDRRFTYEEAQERIETKNGDFAEEINILNSVAIKLRKERFDNDSINFDSEELQFQLDDMKRPIGIIVKERKEAHLLVEDFMLLANKAVAKFIALKSKPEVPYVYRVHDLPNPDKLADFANFARALGYKMDLSGPKAIARSFNKLVDDSRTDERLKVLMPLAIRTMSKAEYSTENIGHYGLGFDYYTHFTSPIRRYSDVLVHRILFENLNTVTRFDKEKLSEQCKHISEQERKAMDAERESVKYKQVEYHQNQIGQIFEARISGMIDRGLFVELMDSKAEGLIKFDTLKGNYILATDKLKAVAKRTGHEYTIGDRVKVKLLDANLPARQLEFQLLEE